MAQGPGNAPILIPSLALEELGARVEVVPYSNFRPENLVLDGARDFNANVTLALREIVDSGSWSRITFVAKSRGTLYLAAMSSSFIVAGGADPYHHRLAHDAVRSELTARELVIEDADHGLVVPGNVRKTVDGFKALAEASLAFASSTV